MGEDLRWLRLEAHRIHVDGRGEREQGPHTKRRDGPTVAAGGTSVRGRRGPAISAGAAVVVVRPEQVDLQRMADRASWHELPQPDHTAEAREHGPAVRAGVAGPKEVFTLLVPP